ncbi:MAG: bifunctional riboflavin kinase/FAD synthetase [Planktomarina sp.]
MQRFSHFPVPDDARGAVAAIGNFDGVHLGHRAVLQQIKTIASTDTKTGVVTFEPHPRRYFAEAMGLPLPPFRLMDADTRANKLELMELDTIFEVPFDAVLAALSPSEFCEHILVGDLGLSHVVVGADFRFGAGRAGDVDTLHQLGQKFGFGVTISDLEQLGDDTVSSTNIRRALADAQPRKAAKMLGHWHRIDGPVLHGEKRGRELGYPTANMSLSDRHLPAFGVYAVTVDVLTGPDAGSYQGAASIGVRPMFGENTPNCETFIFDFKGDLYGQTLSIGLVDFLRGEENFDSLDALILQMAADCTRAQHLLAGL